jgi:hypothetical protein
VIILFLGKPSPLSLHSEGERRGFFIVHRIFQKRIAINAEFLHFSLDKH